MPLDQDQVRDFARTYTEAWCSHDPAGVADHYTPGGTIAINGGEPAEIAEVARSFMSAFPDIQVFMEDVFFKEDTVEFHWTFTGTNTGPGGTGSGSGSQASRSGRSAATASSPSRKATTTRPNTTDSSSTARLRRSRRSGACAAPVQETFPHTRPGERAVLSAGGGAMRRNQETRHGTPEKDGWSGAA